MNSEEFDIDVSQRISAALEERNFVEARQLFLDHPEWQLSEDGLDMWLWLSASRGDLEALQLLVTLGLSVNQSSSHDFPVMPIESAAANGHFEVVRWLLEQGAQLNFERHGLVTCSALFSAARHGHLDIVKLLVEHGADIHAEWHGLNALMHAGSSDVAEYLKSLGVQDLRETRPRDFAATHALVIENLLQKTGKLTGWEITVPGDPQITLHHAGPQVGHESFSPQTIFTTGLSDHKLPSTFSPYHCCELKIQLPADWPISEAALSDPVRQWPVDGLMRIASGLSNLQQLSGGPILFLNGDPPAPLGPNTELCGWIGTFSSGGEWQMPDARWVNMCHLLPIYAEEIGIIKELGYDRNLGHDHSIGTMTHLGFPLVVDPQRSNIGNPESEVPDLSSYSARADARMELQEFDLTLFAEPQFRFDATRLAPAEDSSDNASSNVTDRTLTPPMVVVPGGVFMMGSPDSEYKHDEEEELHEVRITESFLLGTHAVTQELFKDVMGENPSHFTSSRVGEDTSQFPVENVSWFTAIEFCNRMSQREHLLPYYRIDADAVTILGGDGYHLPTEAQWEYACRAGTSTAYFYGDEFDYQKMNCKHLERAKNILKRTTAVGTYGPNGFGLYDMHGNVWEWCQDWYDCDFYDEAGATDPIGPETGRQRVRRGGPWNGKPGSCRSAFRFRWEPDLKDNNTGIRVARAFII